MTEPKKRRVLTEVVIDEISAVDVPCQEGATMTIMKRQSRLTPLREERQMTPFEKRASEIAVADNCSGTEAMRKARLEMEPDEFEAYRCGGPPPVAKAKRAPPAVAEFNRLVAQITRARGVTRTTAMRIARQEHPDAFERMQAADAVASEQAA